MTYEDGKATTEVLVDVYKNFYHQEGISHDMAMAFTKMYVELKVARTLESGLRAVSRSHHGFTGPGHHGFTGPG